MAFLENCCLCQQSYREPRILPCLHTFCLDCLQKVFDESTDEQSAFRCPTCFEPIALSVADLPRHVYSHNEGCTQRRLAEIKESEHCENCKRGEKACAFCRDCADGGLRICKFCLDCHQEFVSYRKHGVVSLDSDLRQAIRERYEKENYVCPKHGDQVLKYFCTSCESLVCNECIVSSHHSHKYDTVECVLEEQKTKLQSMCSVLEQALPHLSRANRESKDVTNSINSHVLSVRREIEEAFSGVMAAVEKRKQEVLAEAEGMAVAKKSRLQIQQEDLERLSIAMTLALDTIQHGTQSYSPVELLSTMGVLKQACSKLEGKFAKASLVPASSPSIVASVSTAGLIKAICSLGSVEERLPCSPSHSGLVGINTKFPIGITKDVKRTLILQVRNSRGEPLGTGQARVNAWLTDKSGRRVCDAEVSSLDGGKYEITFSVLEEFSGEAQFMANGEHVDGSPCDVIVRDYAQVQTPVLSFKTASNPAYVYVCRDSDDIFVTLDNGDVCLYSKDGVVKSTIDGASLGLNSPRGIVVDEDNEVVYVASASKQQDSQSNKRWTASFLCRQ